MTENQETVPTPEEEAELRRENRRRITRFVGVFVITTLALLTSYRYAIHTRLNDWYLFQAARHTALVLDTIGHAQLEPLHYGHYDAQQMRATLKAWADDRNEPDENDLASVPTEPLSAWERWSYRAIEMRRNDAQRIRAAMKAWAEGRNEANENDLASVSAKPLSAWERWSYLAADKRGAGPPRVNGPRVYFVLRQGVSTRIDAVLGEINRFEDDVRIPAEEKEKRLQELNKELEALRQEQQALRAPDTQETDTSLTFPFILVPECGAIEIMAIFLAAVLAFPTLWWKRIVGLVAGLPIMYGVNVFRLTVLAVIGAMDKSRAWFNFAHEYVWQAVYIIFVVAVWLLWVEYIVKRRQT